MPQQGHARLGTRFLQHRVRHAPDLGHQQLRGAIQRRHVAGHRHRVPAMAFEIETRRDIARLRQGQLPRRHQLPRPGKTVGDHHQRAIGAGLLHHRDGRLTRAQVRDLQPRARPFQQENPATSANTARHVTAIRAVTSPLPRFTPPT
jgi:hypothetical protein